jgi:hypothetical protein
MGRPDTPTCAESYRFRVNVQTPRCGLGNVSRPHSGSVWFQWTFDIRSQCVISRTDGPAVAPPRPVTGEQLGRLHQNPFYVQAYEFFLKQSTRLSEILEQMDCSPSTPEQKQAIRLQCEKVKQARLVLQQIWELVLSIPGTSPSLPNHVEV